MSTILPGKPTTDDLLMLWDSSAEAMKSTYHTGVINVLDYGAKGDGVTDDTIAIQAALDAATYNGKVFVPRGTYYLASTLEIPQLVSLVGESATSTVFTSDYNGHIIRSAFLNSTPPRTYSNRGIEIGNFSIVGDLAESSQDGLSILRGASGTQIYNIKVSECGRDGIVIYQCVGTTFTSLYSFDNAGIGIKLTQGYDFWTDFPGTPNGYPTNACIFDDCAASNNDKEGLYLEECHGNNFFGGYFQNSYETWNTSLDKGTHTSTTSATIMTDSTAAFTIDALIGQVIYNLTDDSYGIITDNDATTVTVSTLIGGTDNDWDNGDNYRIGHGVGWNIYLGDDATGNSFFGIWTEATEGVRCHVYSQTTNNAVVSINNFYNHYHTSSAARVERFLVCDRGAVAIYGHSGSSNTYQKTLRNSINIDTLCRCCNNNTSAWIQNNAYSVGDLIENDGTNRYICTIAGTSEDTPAAGPTGTVIDPASRDVTDGTCTWIWDGIDNVGRIFLNGIRHNSSNILQGNQTYYNIESQLSTAPLNLLYAKEIMQFAVTNESYITSGSTTLSSGTIGITFTNSQPDTSYRIIITPTSNIGTNSEFLWATSKATTGFTINSSYASSTATVDWAITRG